MRIFNCKMNFKDLKSEVWYNIIIRKTRFTKKPKYKIRKIGKKLYGELIKN
jgi:hypothetical protein